MSRQDRQIAEMIALERDRLRNFVRKWVPDEADVEDVLQDVFSEFVAAQRAVEPLRQAGAWMFRVARNRITDLFRRRARRREEVSVLRESGDGDDSLEEWLPSPEAGPEAAFARRVLLEELDAALEDLPPEQREAFTAHELEGVGFRELSRRTGVAEATLISRKHYAVLHLRKRLRAIYEEYVDG